MAIETTLDRFVYPRKKDLKAAVQAYINAAPLDTPLQDTLPYAIFDRHPHRDEKTGVGLWYIDLRLTGFKNRGFYAIRLDGTEIDFSWQVALGFAKSGATIEAAAREAVYGQIEAVAVRGMQVHHEGKTFRQLLDGWLAERGGDPPKLIHGDLHDYFRDPADAASWREYHQRHAVLRAVSIEEHKRIHGRQK